MKSSNFQQKCYKNKYTRINIFRERQDYKNIQLLTMCLKKVLEKYILKIAINQKK